MSSDRGDESVDESRHEEPEAERMQRRVDELGEHIDEAVKKAQVTRDQAYPDADQTLSQIAGEWSDTARSDDDPSDAVDEAEDDER
jgi:hypothetical protein